MLAGELFVTLGVVGADKSINSIKGVKNSLGEVASTSLEAKAAIIGMLVAFERLMYASGKTGTTLINTSALLGTPTKLIQQFQYAAQQVGISKDEMLGSLNSLNLGMEELRMGKGQQEGLSLLAGTTHFDINKAIKGGKTDMKYVMDHLQQYFNSETDLLRRNQVDRSFHLGNSIMSGMARNVFTDETYRKAPTYSDPELRQLDKANVAWINLGNKIEMALGHFNAKHGTQLVKDVDKITTSLIGLAEQLVIVSEKWELFEKSSNFITGLANSFKLISEVVDKLGTGRESKEGDLLYTKPGQEAVPGLNDSSLGKMYNAGFKGSPIGQLRELLLGKQKETPIPAPGSYAVPAINNPIHSHKTTNINTNINQTFQGDGSNHKQVGDAARSGTQKAINHAYQTTPIGGR